MEMSKVNKEAFIWISHQASLIERCSWGHGRYKAAINVTKIKVEFL